MISVLLSLVTAQTPLQSYSAAFIEQSRRTDPQIDYTVTLPPSKTLYVLELRIHNAPNPSRLVIPNWAPGAYRLMNAGANISGFAAFTGDGGARSEEHTSELQSQSNLVCRLLLEKKKKKTYTTSCI